MKITKEQIQTFLPHRDPFFFLDNVSEIITPDNFVYEGNNKSLIGCKVVAHFKVTEDLALLAGHFPGNPVLPGVIQLEMMAQASSMLFFLTQADAEREQIEVALLGIDKSRFRKPVIPPMDLVITAELKKVRGHIVSYDGQILNNGELVSEATILASLKVS